MKYCRITLAIMLALILCLSTGCRKAPANTDTPLSQDSLDAAREGLDHPANQIPQEDPNETYAPVDPSQLMSPEEAQDIALEHAGVSESEAVGIHTVMELEDGRQLYEVTFRSGHLEYEYEIDAVTGKIIDWDKDS